MGRTSSHMLQRCIAAVMLAAPATTQSILYVVPPPLGVTGFASSLGAVGDLDGDGAIDFAATAFDCALRAYSGASGDLLFAVPVCSYPFYGGFYDPQGLGDVDGDGRGDFVIADPLAQGLLGRALILSGASGATLHELVGFGELYAWTVAALGDVDGDGARDLATSQPGLSNPAFGIAYVDVWSGRTGALLWRQHATTYDEELEALGSAGDLDGDGRDDLALVRRPLGSSPAGDARLELWSLNGGLLRSFSLTGISGFAAVGDIDGDGTGEFALSHDSGSTPASSSVRIVSPRVGVLAETHGLPYAIEALVPIADLDGDGVPELVGNDPRANSWSGVTVILSGATGALLNVRERSVGGYWSEVDAVGDLDQDGATELVIKDPTKLGESGVVVLRTLALQPLVRFCVATPNSTGRGARLRATGYLTVSDEQLIFTADDLPARTIALFVRGAEPAALPFGDGVLCVSPFAGGLVRIEVALADAAGTATTRALFAVAGGPGTSVIPGSTWSFQCLYRDPAGGPAGFNGSDALRGTFLR